MAKQLFEVRPPIKIIAARFIRLMRVVKREAVRHKIANGALTVPRG